MRTRNVPLQVNITQISTADLVIWLLQKAFLYMIYMSTIEKK